MRRNRLKCGKCGARKSSVTEIAGKAKATCLKCGAEIPLVRDTYGKYHPVRFTKVA